MKYLRLLSALVGLLCSAHLSLAAATVTQTLSIVIQGNFVVVLNPSSVTIPCNATAGTVVTSWTVSGGDGNAITYTLTGTDTTDLVISGQNIVIGPSGITPANCGKSFTDTLTAKQP